VAIALALCGLVACEDVKGGKRNDYVLAPSAQTPPEPGDQYHDMDNNDKKQTAIRKENCDEYPHYACDEELNGMWERDHNCYIPTKRLRTDPDRIRDAYAYLFAQKFGGYDPIYCNPYTLNANPTLHNLMIMRLLAKNPGMADEYEIDVPADITPQIAKLSKLNKVAAFGKLYPDFQEVAAKCKIWDSRKRHKKLPAACLLTMPRQDR